MLFQKSNKKVNAYATLGGNPRITINNNKSIPNGLKLEIFNKSIAQIEGTP